MRRPALPAACLVLVLAAACGKSAPAPTSVATEPAAAEPAAPAGPAGAVPAPSVATGEALPPGHPPIGGDPHGGAAPSAGTGAPAEVEIGTFPVADLSVADLRTQRAAKAGQTVSVRGRVIKVNHGILDRNWLHLKDSSEGKLVVTSKADAPVGALVLAKGKIAVDKDLGAGYQYDVLMEDAEVTVEPAGAPAAPTPATP